MAYFAELDENSIVLRVLVVDDNKIIDGSGNVSEELGISFLRSLFGENTNWALGEPDGGLRVNYPCIGSLYDESMNVFITPQPYPSWVLNANTVKWEAPVPCPGAIENYYWDENDLGWKIRDNSNVPDYLTQ